MNENENETGQESLLCAPMTSQRARVGERAITLRAYVRTLPSAVSQIEHRRCQRSFDPVEKAQLSASKVLCSLRPDVHRQSRALDEALVAGAALVRAV